MDNYFMKDFYNYKRYHDLNKVRLDYIIEDIRNINIQIDIINYEITTITNEYLNNSILENNKIIKDYSTNYLADLNDLKNTFTIKLNECKTLSKKITNNIEYYNNLLGIETTIINDYINGTKKQEFKKLFPTYDAYKDCILNM